MRWLMNQNFHYMNHDTQARIPLLVGFSEEVHGVQPVRLFDS